MKVRHRILSLSILCLFATYLTVSSQVRPSIEPDKGTKTRILKKDTTSRGKQGSGKVKSAEGEPILINIDTATYINRKDANSPIILTDHVVFYHDGAYLHCDSAAYNDITNSFEAFENVKMIQGDTIFLTGKYMHYDGNTMVARVRENVILEHRPQNVFLYTDSLDYDRSQNIGYYFSGGRLVDTINVLTSEWGQYEPNYNLAKFLDNVKLVNPNFVLYSEELDYYTHNQMANILTESRIVSDSGTIYTSNGWYNTNTEESLLLNRSRVVNRAGNQTLTGDSIFYNKMKGFGEAHGNVELQDTIQKTILRGHYMFYNELTDYAMATDSAYAIEYSKGDSLFIHADTLKLITVFADQLEFKKVIVPVTDSMQVDSSMLQLGADHSLKLDSMSLAAESDAMLQAQSIQKNDEAAADRQEELILNKDSVKSVTPDGDAIRLIKAYYGVRFYRSDLQGVCDSMQFSSVDSVLHMYKDPVLWNEGNQISGDSIDIFMSDSTIRLVHVKGYSFSIEQMDSLMYNQMKGRSLKAFFTNGGISKVLVEGNAESVFYPEEKDKSIIGLNWLESGFLEILIKDGALERIKAWGGTPRGQTTPLEMIKSEQRQLDGFYWYDYLRPLNSKDIFRKVTKKATDIRPPRAPIIDDDDDY